MPSSTSARRTGRASRFRFAELCCGGFAISSTPQKVLVGGFEFWFELFLNNSLQFLNFHASCKFPHVHVDGARASGIASLKLQMKGPVFSTDVVRGVRRIIVTATLQTQLIELKNYNDKFDNATAPASITARQTHAVRGSQTG
jgi:hypothetical protein